MLMSDPKKLAVTIISAHKPSSSSYSQMKKDNESFDPKEDGKEEELGLESAMEEFANACGLKDFDAKAMAKAFKAANDVCESYEDEDEGDEPEESSDQSEEHA